MVVSKLDWNVAASANGTMSYTKVVNIKDTRMVNIVGAASPLLSRLFLILVVAFAASMFQQRTFDFAAFQSLENAYWMMQW